MRLAKDTILSAFRLIVGEAAALFLFELFYKYLLLLVSPLIQIIFSQALKQAGISFLTNQTLPILFSSPGAVLLLLLFLLLSAYVTLIELCAILLYFDSVHNARPVSVWRFIKGSAKKAASAIRPKNAPILLFLVLCMPVTGFPFTSGPLLSLRIPNFITDYIRDYPALSVFFLLLTIGVWLLLFRWFLVIYQVFLTEQDFFAVLKSRHYSRKPAPGPARQIPAMAAWAFVTALAAVLFCFAAVLLTLFYTRLTAEGNPLDLFWIYFFKLSAFGQTIGPIYFLICSLALMAALYYQSAEPAAKVVPSKTRRKRTAFSFLRLLVLALLFPLLAEHLPLGWYRPGDPWTVRVIAHRGGALLAPENTLAAIAEAVRTGAHYAEIDIRMTRDQIPVLSHDSSLKRMTGVKKQIRDLTLKQVQTIRLSGAPIPSLEQALTSARGKIDLIIELKDSGPAAEAAVLDLIQQYHYTGHCIVASTKYQVLERIKERNPEQKTCLLAALAYGNVNHMTAADTFGIEETFLSEPLLSEAHRLGKLVFVWTVNTEKSMRRLIRMQADGIITDNPPLAGYVIRTGGANAFVAGLARQLLDAP